MWERTCALNISLSFLTVSVFSEFIFIFFCPNSFSALHVFVPSCCLGNTCLSNYHINLIMVLIFREWIYKMYYHNGILSSKICPYICDFVPTKYSLVNIPQWPSMNRPYGHAKLIGEFACMNCATINIYMLFWESFL
jgi:hypothetical protein